MTNVSHFDLDDNPKPLDPAAEAGAVVSDASRPDPTAPGAPKRRGRPPGSTNRNRAKPAKARRSRVLEAQMLNRIFYAGCANFGGDEMLPTDTEREELDLALAEYIEMNGGAPVPPWLILTLAYSSFVLTKTTKPSVREKLGEKFTMIRGAFRIAISPLKKLFKRKEKKGDENAPR